MVCWVSGNKERSRPVFRQSHPKSKSHGNLARRCCKEVMGKTQMHVELEMICITYRCSLRGCHTHALQGTWRGWSDNTGGLDTGQKEHTRGLGRLEAGGMQCCMGATLAHVAECTKDRR